VVLPNKEADTMITFFNQFYRILYICGAGAVATLLAAASPLQPAAVAQTPLPGSIHGNVALFVVPDDGLSSTASLAPTGIGAGSTVFLPNIQVIARNIQTSATSAPVLTNAEGYFQTPVLPPGQYQVCASAPGFSANCLDQTIEVFQPLVLLRQIIPVRPEELAIVGTATLADHKTPCFFFRPSFSPLALTAKASLVNKEGKVLAGPVDGNASGQYVLPVREAVQDTLRVTCDASVVEAPVTSRRRLTLQNTTIGASVPQILAFDFTKGGVGIRRADPGETVNVNLLARDPDGNTLHYTWVDDSGRALSLPDAPAVSWPLLNANALNALIVYVSNGKGGIATYRRTLQSGSNEIVFAGNVFNRQTTAAVADADVSVNGVTVATDAGGNFRVSAPDAGRFVLNVTKPGFSAASLVLINPAVGIKIPVDPVQTVTINGATGGTVSGGSGGACTCQCGGPGGKDGGHAEGYDERFHVLIEIPETRIDIRHGDGKDGDGGKGRGGQCVPAGAGGNLTVGFEPGSFVTGSGAPYTGTVSVEMFQYDLSQPNPIPGDLGAIYQGKSVRLGSFGAFQLLPRDAQGKPLAMAPGKKASVSMPIQQSQLSAAPATIPFFHYDLTSGLWLEDGALTLSGNAYVGEVTHFSLFNADTVFPGGACIKVLLSGFVMPVTLDATYFDPSVGTFHHNGFPTSDTTVGVERIAPNQNFTLNITDSGNPPAKQSVALFSGPGLDQNQFPSGYDTLPSPPNPPNTLDLTFAACNGPVQIGNQGLPPNQPSWLLPVFGGNPPNPAAYQTATNAQAGGSRDTFPHWKATNGFVPSSVTPKNGLQCTPPSAGESCALYFNNGDLKFGRDMHCRVTASGTTACYVSNFGNVGTNDAQTAVPDAENYEASGQVTPAPGATVAMEYDPTKGANAVQFWAYKQDGSYFINPSPSLDSQGPKPMPEICMGCHQGTYSDQAGATVSGAAFLAFDLDSFLDDTATRFPISGEVTAAVQTQFHQLNNMIAGTNPPAGVTQLVNLWYANTTATTPFTFNQGAAQLPAQPFFVGGVHHEPLYDNVVKLVCRTCHAPQPGVEWNTFAEMSGDAGFIQSLSCAPTVTMPHAEVPWTLFWQQSLSATLASELGNTAFPNGCPPN
jgi:hypothetical protein